jgi:hypothetical protein
MTKKPFYRAPNADANGYTTLMDLCNQNAQITRVVAQLLYDPVNAQDRDGRTALHYALNMHRLDHAIALLEHGADPNLQDAWGTHPLLDVMYSLHNYEPQDRIRLLAAMLRAGGDLDLRNDAGDVARDWLDGDYPRESGATAALTEAMVQTGTPHRTKTAADRREDAACENLPKKAAANPKKAAKKASRKRSP